MSRQRHIEKCHEYAMDRISDVLIELQDETVGPLVEEIATLRKRLWDAELDAAEDAGDAFAAAWAAADAAAAGDAARAEVEDWKRQCATRSSDIGRLEGALATLTADRDALAERVKAAEVERDAYRQDAACLRHRAEAGDAAVAALAKLREEYGDSDSLRSYIGKFVSQRDRSEARAERLAAALLSVRAAIEANATDTLWCDDDTNMTAVERIEIALAADTAEKETRE